MFVLLAFSFFFLMIHLYFMCIGVLPVCVSVRVLESFGTGAKDSFELPCGCW